MLKLGLGSCPEYPCEGRSVEGREQLNITGRKSPSYILYRVVCTYVRTISVRKEALDKSDKSHWPKIRAIKAIGLR